MFSRPFRSLTTAIGWLQRRYFRWVVSFNPTEERGVGDVEVAFSWQEWRERITFNQVFFCCLEVFATLLLAMAVFSIHPVLRFSFVNGVAELVNLTLSLGFGTDLRLSTIFVILMLVMLATSGERVTNIFGGASVIRNHLPQMAMNEEITFRLGSENLSNWQRFKSCLSFGAAHLGMLIVPLAVVPVLSLFAGVWMVLYLRKLKQTQSQDEALHYVASLHATHNVVAFLFVFGIAFFTIVVATGVFIAQLVT